jgi:hypothetical protein
MVYGREGGIELSAEEVDWSEFFAGGGEIGFEIRENASDAGEIASECEEFVAGGREYVAGS